MLKGKKVLISAGPTREKIDEVRYISNFSSGKMGFALAIAAKNAGAEVILITGPVNLVTPEGIKRKDVESAEDMFNEMMKYYEQQDIIIMSAAVADFTPADYYAGKIKKNEKGEKFIIELKPTKDILGTLGKIKMPHQILVGFALESINELEYGKEKLIRKNCDMIVVNSANKPQSGFSGDYNTITIIDKNGNISSFEPMTKQKCAEEIIGKIEFQINHI
jgi:phosphopantothenoylcysteine decarboxylase/phosphopantothenate--cysteine ligase